MAKIKIPFNNTDYSIDESALSSATENLKSHLQTVMNGTGAVINFGGVSYNVDQTKLSEATNNFVAYHNNSNIVGVVNVVSSRTEII